MKSIILLAVLSFGAIAFAACGQTANNRNLINNNSVSTNSGSPMNMNGMNHDSMPMDHSQMRSDQNAASAPYDLQYIDTMSAHHSGAVDMARMVDGRTENADLKKFAADIIRDQEREIAQMKNWREKWFAGTQPAMNMEMPGMADSMKMDMTMLSNSKEKEFDRAFIEMMIPHHEGAVTMAKEALLKAEHPEIKTLSNQIIKSQEAEVNLMADWKAKWNN